MTKRLAIVLVIILGIAAIVLAVSVSGTQYIVSQPFVVVVLNLVFLSAVLFLIAFLAARSYMATVEHQMLWLGAGSLAFGLGSLFYGIQHSSNPNAALTAYCLGALVAAVFYLHRLFPWPNNLNNIQQAAFRRKLQMVLIYYLPVSIALIVIDILATNGTLPIFYYGTTGSTFLSNLVITAIIILFLVAFINNLSVYYRTRLEFLFWYSFALLLMAAGLLLLVLSPNNNPLSWLGRVAQYIGGLYLIMAVFDSLKHSRAQKISIERAVASFFKDPQANYELLMKSSGDAVIATDSNGTILMWNPAAERTFGYKQTEVVGLDICRLFANHRGDNIKDKLRSLKQQSTDGIIIDQQQEMQAWKKNGEEIPVSITLSARKIPEGWMVVIIARDITEIKKAREALIQANQGLEAKVKERTAELETLNEQLRLMAGKMILTEEEERKRIATELHDNIGQMLAVCNLELESALKRAPAELKERLETLLSIIRKLSDEARSLMFQLSPPILYDLGLEPAVEELAVLFEQRNDFVISVNWNGQPTPLSIETKIILFQLARELFAEIINYSRATRIMVSFYNNDEFEMLFEDNSVEFGPQAVESSKEKDGFRLFQIQEHIRNIGGHLEIQTEPGKGPWIRISVPLTH